MIKKKVLALDDLVSDKDARDREEGIGFSPDYFTCSASGTNERIKNVPQWAVNYLEYADVSGLEPDDVKTVDDWVDGITAEGLTLLGPVNGSENEFCSCPAFGPASSTVDYMAARQQPYITRSEVSHVNTAFEVEEEN